MPSLKARRAGILNKWSALTRGTYDRAMDIAARPEAPWILAVAAFAESSFFPIPPDILLIPMVLAIREKALRYALICTVASVLGGFAGYGIGMFLYAGVAEPILEFYGYLDRFDTFRAAYNEWGAWIVGGAGLTPFPYKVITIGSGATRLDPVVFGVASVLSRGVRFYALSLLLKIFGERIRGFIERRLGLLTTLFFILLFGGFLLLKFV